MALAGKHPSTSTVIKWNSFSFQSLDLSFCLFGFVNRCVWYHLVRFLGVAILWETLYASDHYAQRASIHRRIIVACTAHHSQLLYDSMALLFHIHARLRHHCGKFLPFVDFLLAYPFAAELFQASLQVRHRKSWSFGCSSSFGHDDHRTNWRTISRSFTSQQNPFDDICTQDFQLRRIRDGSYLLNGKMTVIFYWRASRNSLLIKNVKTLLNRWWLIHATQPLQSQP